MTGFLIFSIICHNSFEYINLYFKLCQLVLYSDNPFCIVAREMISAIHVEGRAPDARSPFLDDTIGDSPVLCLSCTETDAMQFRILLDQLMTAEIVYPALELTGLLTKEDTVNDRFPHDILDLST